MSLINKNIQEYESQHLELTKQRLRDAISRSGQILAQSQANLKDANEYLWDQLGSAPGDFLQATEFSQNLVVEKQVLEQLESARKHVKRYTRLLDKPYFARIDYKENGESDYEDLYIGYGNFMDDQTLDIYIYDWRTPIASVFYDYEIGQVRYKAPDGYIFGDVRLKRQFDIQNSVLKHAYDTKAHIADERLVAALSERTAGPMRQIVETIQSEQNKIIRERKSPALFVDGIAGSGKTVVALHRIAYLMYHGIKNSLSAHNVLIVSPNDVFSDYISHVIPELGEEQVRTDTLMGILDTVCPCSYKTEHPSSLLEPSLLNLDHRPLQMDKLKQSEWMPTLLTKFVETYTNDHIEYSDVFYGDIRLATAKSIKNALTDTTRNRPIKLRMERQSEQIKSKTRQHVKALTKQLTFDILMAGDHPFDHRAVVRLERYKTFSNLSRTLSQMVSFTAIDVYRALLEDADYWTDHVGSTDHEAIRDLCQSTLQALDRGIVTRTDHVILAYISLLIGDSAEMTSIKHVVIDESQDYHATDYALFRRLYPKANFTILGDVHQSLNEEKDDSHHRRAQRMLGFDDALHMRLTTAYRNASGISDLCLGLFSDTAALGRIERKGKKPLLHHKRDENTIKNLIQTCFDEGHRTVAIITKTMEKAQYLFQNELKSMDPHLITEDTLTLPDGLIVCPVYFAKGMEFDAVIIADADKEVYNTERDRQYLYIAASRALHELHLVSKGSPTPLLDFYFK